MTHLQILFLKKNTLKNYTNSIIKHYLIKHQKQRTIGCKKIRYRQVYYLQNDTKRESKLDRKSIKRDGLAQTKNSNTLINNTL